MDPALDGCTDDCSCYWRQKVCVLMGVDVTDMDAGCLQFSNLGGGFCLDLILFDLLTEYCEIKAGEVRSDVWRRRGARRWFDERGDL